MDTKAETIRAVFTCQISLLESTQRQLDELSRTVISLQAAVRGLDPTFDDVHQAKADEINAALEPLAERRAGQFRELHQLIVALDLG